MATYLTKSFSLRRYGEDLVKIMDGHFASVVNLDKERTEATTNYVNAALKTRLEDLDERSAALRSRTLSQINEIETDGISSIDNLAKSMKPEDIVQNDLMLLDDRIFPVEQAVFDRLAETYKNNFAMT